MLKRALMAAAMAFATASSHAQLITEGFENVGALAGWELINQSSPVGSTGWFQGGSDIFAAQAGAADSFIAANFNNSNVGGTISNWLLSPTFSTATAGTVTFYARAEILDPYFDQIRFTFHGGVGNDTATFTGGTTTTLTGSWVPYTFNFAAQGAGTLGRVGINYFGNADSSNYIGIDTFSVASVPEPSTWLLMSAGLLGVGVLRRRSHTV